MKKGIFIFSLLVVFLCFQNGGFKERGETLQSTLLKSQPRVSMDVDFGKIPLYFILNQGQVDQQARFYAKASGYTLWLTREGLVFDSIRRHKSEEGKENHSKFKINNSKLIKRDVSRLMFIGANKNFELAAFDRAELKVNYFIGNDRSKWNCNVPTSRVVLYRNLYKNVDLKIYGIEKQIEYDWLVKAGGDPDDIRFVYQDVKSTYINKQGNLGIKTEFGELIHKKPDSYQIIDGIKVRVEVKFKKITENTYGFEVGEYDKSIELVIDPLVLFYSTYLGGGQNDRGKGIAVDSSGYVYVTGSTESTDFPTLNQYQTDQSGWDVFVTKLDTTQSGASSLIYSTYLGGNASDFAYGIAVDGSGNAYVTGETESTDFPTLNQYQTDQINKDAFVTKLDTTLSGASSLVYSTYLGGGSYDWGYSIAVDSSGYAYVTGSTESTNFPTLNQYMTEPVDGHEDAFVTKLDTTKNGAFSLIYSTYLGGDFSDFGYGIAVDSSGYVYVTGETESTDFPTLNQYQTDQPESDAFVTKLDTTKNGAFSLIYSTYLGGDFGDLGYGIAVDSSGYVYVSGETFSTNFPTLNQYQTDQPEGDAFVTKLDTTQSGAAGLIYSTYLGGGGSEERGLGIAIGSSGNVYVAGRTASTDFPTVNQYMADPGDSECDVFVTRIDTTQSGAASVIYSTYLGGDECDHGSGIAVGSSGNAYVTGDTESSNFPTENQYQAHQGNYDAFVTKLSYIILPTVTTAAVSEITPTSALSGGTVTDNGGSAVTSRGVCCSTNSHPTLSNSQVENSGSGLGSFTCQLTGLTPGTTYYVRAWARNSAGVGYGEVFSFRSLSIVLSLQAVRKTERAWIIQRDYGEITVQVDSQNHMEALRCILYRREDNGAFVVINEISGSQLENSMYHYIDTYLEKDRNYTYYLIVADSAGVVLAVSNQQTI